MLPVFLTGNILNIYLHLTADRVLAEAMLQSGIKGAAYENVSKAFNMPYIPIGKLLK
jgi:alanine dehydrogenase